LITDKYKRLNIAILFLVLLSFFASHLCFSLFPDICETFNAKVFDSLFLLRTKYFTPHYDDRIVHVDLNNTTIRELNTYYPDRSHDARVIRNLSAMQVAVQMHDLMYVARKDDTIDMALVKAAENAGNVYFGMAFGELKKETRSRQFSSLNEMDLNYLERTHWEIRLEEKSDSLYIGSNPLITFRSLSEVSKGLGFINVQPDRDGVFRRIPLLVRYNSSYYPSFSFRGICDYLDVAPDNIIVSPGKFIRLKGAKRPEEETRHDIVIPIDPYGRMIISYVGPWETMKHYNYSDIYFASDDPDELEMFKEELSGKIALISDVSSRSTDVGPVPTDTHFPLSGLHANAMHTIVSEAFLRELSPEKMFLIEMSMAVVILMISIRFSALYFSLGSFFVLGSFAAVTVISFLYFNLLLNIVRPFMMIVLAMATTVIYRYFNEEKEKAVLRRTFEAYFPPTIVKKILENPNILDTGGQKKELTIMFSDIVDFTKYSSSVSPDEVQKRLNAYFESMTEIVFKYHGTVDKFIGDGLMVFFGDPEPLPDHALKCVRAAIDMQKWIRDRKPEWENHGDIPVEIRIGINTGMVVVGNMGSSKRMSYTVLGSAVNLAQRLEANAPVNGILISQQTYALVKDHIRTDRPRDIQVKGFKNSIRVYDVLGLDEGSPPKVLT
jgi:adenylate cyclase